ncbi:MAG: YbbR-like domain-containing protein [Tannerella sp.]|jgi:hypothetical protein|nr:YbbR-like domain-containing protein [Tannerella sp.]
MENNFISALKLMLRNIGTFFRSQQWKEILIFLFFLLLSFGFWFLQSLQQDYERKIELPVRYKNIPSEWILSENNPEKIDVLLKDKGMTLMYYSWKVNFLPVEISVSNLSRSAGHTLQVTTRTLETMVSKQLISSTSILSIEPREIHIEYDSLSHRTVPVVANVIIQTKPGFRVSDSIKISHPEIRIYGSVKTLDTLKYVRTKRITVDNVSATRELTVALDLPAGVKTDHESVKLTIPVEEYTEKRLQLPVLCSDIPSGQVLRIFPSTVEVICGIPLSLFKELTVNDLEIRIPFRDFQKYRLTGKMPVKLTGKPSWVASAVVIPDEVEFIIEQLTEE